MYTIGVDTFEVLKDQSVYLGASDPHTGKAKRLPLLLDYLNMLGKDGWELVSMVPYGIPISPGMFSNSSASYITILKRLEQDTP
jgi:hypothetical protein